MTDSFSWLFRTGLPASSSYSALARTTLGSISIRFCALTMGWPPPVTQPPGQAMTSMKVYFFSPALMLSSSFAALAVPWAMATATSRSPTFTVASLTPWMPRTSWNSTGSSVSPVTFS